MKCKTLLSGYRQLPCSCKNKDIVYRDIAEDVETRFDTLNFELDRPLSKEKSKKVTDLMKFELGG